MHNTTYNGKLIRFNGIAKSKEPQPGSEHGFFLPVGITVARILYKSSYIANELQVYYNQTLTKDLVWDFDHREVFVSPQNMFVTDKDPQNWEFLIYVIC